MEFRILGPLEALEEGDRVALGGSRQRALLAVFLLHANETLSTDRLIDELWGERPPTTAGKTVQVRISRLRKALTAGSDDSGANGLLVTRDYGYELRLDPGSGYKKCARVVGDVIGKFHPHGELAVYDALVRLARQQVRTGLSRNGRKSPGPALHRHQRARYYP